MHLFIHVLVLKWQVKIWSLNSFSCCIHRYNMGLIPTKQNLGLCDKVTASSFCRRRLPVVMVRLKMAETVESAVKFVEHGRILWTDKAVLPARKAWLIAVLFICDNFISSKVSQKFKINFCAFKLICRLVDNAHFDFYKSLQYNWW